MSLSVLRTDLHTHTVASGHAFSTLNEIARSARAAQLELVGVTDHGPGMEGAPHAGYFEMSPRLPDTVDGIRVLMGIEANILDISGSLDLDDARLSLQGIVLAGLHGRTSYVGSTAEANTKAIMAVMSRGYVHVISHPYRNDYPTDVVELARGAASTGVLLELNVSLLRHSFAHPGAEGVVSQTRRMLDALHDLGGRCAISSDAHHSSEIEGFPASSSEILAKLEVPADLIANRDIESLRAHGWDL